ncbi:alpha/beta hydrolase family protein [Shewanella sp. 1CM18E]|uniref:DUF3530 family protein n=1 Tax=Shewanella sp. 1CM18E TaxID=2929169 RepID=UPI0020C10D87|nr:DUF3530 family protein [Shewanella sp. 1CM18E]MCK8045875.1 alpha/beta hydrolase family protein [Shewanella sp. 1CM18E]
MKFSAFLSQLVVFSCFAYTLLGPHHLFAAEQKMLSIADYRYLPANEVKQLQVDGKQVPALLRPWLGKKQYGLAIIVPDLSARADAAGVTNYLRLQLNQLGWATLAITPPSLETPPYFATRADDINQAGEQNNSQLANQETPDFSAQQLADIQQQQQTFLQTSMTQLDSLGKEFSGKRMLIAFGESANLVIELLDKQGLPAPDILVVINPYSDIDSVNAQLAPKLAQLPMPILDLQSKDGSAASIATQSQRLTLAPANAPTRYSQQVLALDLSLKVTWDNTLKLIAGFAQRINKAYPNG